MRVLKFGGTSVADGQAMQRVIAITAAERGARTVVVSALSGVTDALLDVAHLACRDEDSAVARLEALTRRHHDIAQDIRRDALRRWVAAAIDGIARSARLTVAAINGSGAPRPPAALSDRLAAVGELWSSQLVAAMFEDAGLLARWVDARDVMRTDGRHRSATADLAATAEAVDRVIRPALAVDRIVIIGGFIGSSPEKLTTTLGRGGSDYSAAVLGACLSAQEIQIWTDVDGVLTADPRVIAHARPVEWLSYAEAHDLATFGAKVLHPATIQPAASRNIPVRVLNSRRPEAPGTLIGPGQSSADGQLTAVACRSGVTLVEVVSRDARSREPFAATIFRELAQCGTPVVLADLCANRLSLAVDESADLDAFHAQVAPHADVRFRQGLAAVCAVGRGWLADPRLIREALAVLGDTPVHMVARPSARSPLAVVVDEAHAISVMTRLHDGCLYDDVAQEVEP